MEKILQMIFFFSIFGNLIKVHGKNVISTKFSSFEVNTNGDSSQTFWHENTLVVRNNSNFPEENVLVD